MEGTVQIALIGYGQVGTIVSVKQLSIDPNCNIEHVSVINSATSMFNDDAQIVELVYSKTQRLAIDKKDVELIKPILQTFTRVNKKTA